jgi:serine/threonine protein kinase
MVKTGIDRYTWLTVGKRFTVPNDRTRVSNLTQSFLGTYRLLAPIRTGRYTQVWAAIDDVAQRYVAAKLLLPEYRRDREQLRMMRHELEIGRRLQHPGCLGAFEMRQTSQGSFLLMELFHGDNLRDVLKRRREEIRRRLPSIVRQAAEGLSHLNAVGFVHLDVKPENYMLDDAGHVRLIDFGLARRPPNAWERFFWKQRQKKIQGTRSYLSPEQIRREPIDARSDVYSFGCTLFHLAAGVPPFTAGSSDELLSKHLYAPPPKLAVEAPDVSNEFSDLVRWMMGKRPVDRPPSVGALLTDLATMEFFKPAEESGLIARPAASN